MKGDFSRIRFSKKREREKDYRKVLFQQGRVLTDADWNDQIDIQEHQEIRYLRDIIGKNGVPLEQKENSFKITPIVTPEGHSSYTIGKGKIYVDGILVENHSDVEAGVQPYLPSLSVQDLPSDIIPKEEGIYLTYLDVWHRHITYLEDPDIQESALGGPDTTTRSQIVWQVKLHRLKEGEGINENDSEVNRWVPWISLNNNVFDMKIGKNKEGSLELFAIKLEQGPGPDRMGIITRRRQVSTNPDKWEDQWHEDLASSNRKFLNIEISSNRNGFLELFGILDGDRVIAKSSRLADSSWTAWNTAPRLSAKQIAVGTNKDGKLELFAIKIEDEKIYHSKQMDNIIQWEQWKPIDGNNIQFTKLSVISNPNDDRIEIYAVEKTGRKIWFTRQKDSASSDWEDWKEINPSDPRRFSDIAAWINRNKDSIIFAIDSSHKDVWRTIRREPDFSEWSKVGNIFPSGEVINSISVQKNVNKKGRLELFASSSNILSNPPFGSIWNISEKEDRQWNSDWKTIEGLQGGNKISSATDSLSRLKVFALDPTGSVNYSNQEDTEIVLDCDMPIKSWDSKTKPSSGQLQGRTRPQELPSDSCMLPERAGYKRLENQLYRIEIHEPKSSERNATFKYSRDNGTVCSKILDISGEKITVTSIGRDTLLGFNSGQWIEITDDLHELGGSPAFLFA